MDRFKRILFVINGPEADSRALARALSLALRNQGKLSLLVIHPPLSDSFDDYKAGFRDFLRERARADLRKAMSHLELDELPASLEFSLHIEGGHAPQAHVVRRVLLEGFDLVFKAADPVEGGRGFMALDMGLLRTCPVPVWLWRHSTEEQHGAVAVAIDPADDTPRARALSLRLIEAADHMASLLGTRLVVLSCWDYPLENYLRNRAFGGTPESRLEEIAADDRRRHRAALDTLIREARPENSPEVHHYHGHPEDRIPEYTSDNQVHTLVMGTLARTGIPGFVIGNTAENLLRRLQCSLLAMKPPGFVSPIKPAA